LYYYLFYFILFFAENRIPQSIVASFTHDIFIKGCQVNFTIDGPQDVEVGALYPDETFRTLDECFNDFLVNIDSKSKSTDEITTASPVAEPMAVTAAYA
jgi:leucoanthocyanidin reductase